MAQNEEKMQADQAAFGAHYIDDTIHADKAAARPHLLKNFCREKQQSLDL